MTAQERLEEILIVVRDAHMDAQDDKITWEQALSEVLVTMKYDSKEVTDPDEIHSLLLEEQGADTQILVFQVNITCRGDEVEDIAQMERNIEDALAGPVSVPITPEDEDNYAQEVHVEYLHDMIP